MNKIQNKIILLSMVIMLIMGAFWFIMTMLNNQSSQVYNTILKRYLLLNEVSTYSDNAIAHLNQYISIPSKSNQELYEQIKGEFNSLSKSVHQIQNDRNIITITGYIEMINRQIHEMDAAVLSLENQNSINVNYHAEEAAKISQYINETTLTLFKQEVRFHEKVYLEIFELSRNLNRLGLLSITVIFLLLVAFSYWVSKGITRSIHILLQGAKQISKGIFQYPIKIDSNDEIAFLGDTFDQMRQNLKRSIEEMKQKAELEKRLQQSQLLLQEKELQRLQSQMNPHFLFNTLNLLSKKAYLEGAEQTSDLIVSVSNLLRYNLSKYDEPVKLSEEIFIVKEYFTILKARFTKRLSVSYEIDEQCLNYLIPNLILQPLIENAFIHAIEPFEDGGEIILRVRDMENEIVIEVEDDGPGIDATADTQEQKKGNSIGLENVRKRLELFYSSENVMNISSIQGQGTTIILHLPKG
ncbi:sensor histidine kinase [Bacillus solimangrovi]|uniref:histidine kinase n=1 Tax=Bacillus solimangrovi TaxID=1305675 RepID=A0A1E5LIC8_9BACI|nr:histidine kinase [Bacillus solimangrovi]OEH93825.1 hypothetical protein BFG57_10910 [Bacillus solimangrovi]